MLNPRHMLALACACVALGISFLPAIASAETSPVAGAFTTSATTATSTTSTTNCPSGKCFEEAAEWVEGTTITAAGGSASGGKSVSAIIRETPVSKLKKIKKSYEKKYHVVVGYYQNPHGYQGPKSQCIDPTKVPRWHFHAGEYVKTTNHLREHVPAERWNKGEKICDWKEVKINGRWWVHGTQELCSNVETWIPITVRIRKPRRVYVQFPTVEKFYEIAFKRLEIKSEAEGGSGEGGSTTVKIPGHYQCKPGGVLNGKMCKYCPPPSCEPPCTSCEEEPSCPSCEPTECCVKFGNEFEFEEAYVNEDPIRYYIDVFAPKGHELSIYFETREAHFSPHEIKVPSAGAQTRFESQWFAPSHPGQYPVWVKVWDRTTGEICESEVQWVTVHSWELEEPPS